MGAQVGGLTVPELAQVVRILQTKFPNPDQLAIDSVQPIFHPQPGSVERGDSGYLVHARLVQRDPVMVQQGVDFVVDWQQDAPDEKESWFVLDLFSWLVTV